MDNKTTAIVAHLTIIGWIVALVMNSNEKSDLVSFYLRQYLGIMLIGILGSLLSFIYILSLAVFVIAIALWLVSIIGAVSGEKKELPVVGEYFQDWFKGV